MKQAWNNDPEPSMPTLDPQTILDMGVARHDAYLWHSQNSSEGWLAYDGELLEIKE